MLQYMQVKSKKKYFAVLSITNGEQYISLELAR